MELLVLLGGTIIGLLILVGIAKILGFSFKMMIKLLINAVSGAIALFLFNIIGGIFGIGIPITFLNALITGIFGIPGVVFLLILQFI